MAMQKVLEEEQFKNICLVVLSLYLSSLSGLSGLSEVFGVAMAMKKPNGGCHRGNQQTWGRITTWESSRNDGLSVFLPFWSFRLRYTTLLLSDRGFITLNQMENP
jgi:hypothetical protein